MTYTIDKPKNLEGLGRWLILIGIGLIISPFVDLFEIATTEADTLVDITINSLAVIVDCYLIYLFFAMKKFFPKLYIWVLILNLLAVLSSAAMIEFDGSILDSSTLKDIKRAIFAVIVWVPYMIKSKRVKATFIR